MNLIERFFEINSRSSTFAASSIEVSQFPNDSRMDRHLWSELSGDSFAVADGPDPSQWQQGLLTAQLGKREKSLCVTSRALRKKLCESTWLQSDGRRWVWKSSLTNPTPLTAIDSAVPNSSSLMRPLGMSLEPIIADVSYIGSTENSPTKRFSLHIVNRGQACLAAPVR